MPGYKGHIVGGLIIGTGAVYISTILGWLHPSITRLTIIFGLILAGALFPDVDTDSKGQNLFYSILVIVDIYLIMKKEYKDAAILGFLALLPALGHHRGWTHTWWAMFLVPIPIVVIIIVVFHYSWHTAIVFYTAAVIGYLSHLILDFLL